MGNDIVEIVNSDGFDYASSIAGRLNKNHAAYLNKKVTLPVIHASVLSNIRNGGRGGKTFFPLSDYTKKNKRKSNIKKNVANHQPSNLGRQSAPGMRILIRSGKLWNNLGTINRSSARSVQYGIRYADQYMQDVIYGRPQKQGTVFVASYNVAGHYRISKSGDKTWVRGHVVKDHTRKGTLAALPERNPFYLINSDIKILESVFLNYYTASTKKKYVFIRTHMKFTANRKIRILPNKGTGRRIIKA